MYSKYFKEGRTVMKLKRILAAGLILSMTAVSYTHLTLPTIA